MLKNISILSLFSFFLLVSGCKNSASSVGTHLELEDTQTVVTPAVEIEEDSDAEEVEVENLTKLPDVIPCPYALTGARQAFADLGIQFSYDCNPLKVLLKEDPDNVLAHQYYTQIKSLDAELVKEIAKWKKENIAFASDTLKTVSSEMIEQISERQSKAIGGTEIEDTYNEIPRSITVSVAGVNKKIKREASSGRDKVEIPHSYLMREGAADMSYLNYFAYWYTAKQSVEHYLDAELRRIFSEGELLSEATDYPAHKSLQFYLDLPELSAVKRPFVAVGGFGQTRILKSLMEPVIERIQPYLSSLAELRSMGLSVFTLSKKENRDRVIPSSLSTAPLKFHVGQKDVKSVEQKIPLIEKLMAFEGYTVPVVFDLESYKEDLSEGSELHPVVAKIVSSNFRNALSALVKTYASNASKKGYFETVELSFRRAQESHISFSSEAKHVTLYPLSLYEHTNGNIYKMITDLSQWLASGAKAEEVPVI